MSRATSDPTLRDNVLYYVDICLYYIYIGCGEVRSRGYPRISREQFAEVLHFDTGNSLQKEIELSIAHALHGCTDLL